MSATGDFRRARQRRGVRLTRRGRIVVVVLVVAALLTGLWLGTRQSSIASTSAADTARLGETVVPPGGTLWEIAVVADPDADPRVTVRRIMDLNGLSRPIVHPGDRLRLPSSG